MKNDPQLSASEPRIGTIGSLMLAVFVVSLGYGVVLPSLPYLIERLLGAGVAAAQVSRHTGLLTGAYALALFLFAPIWGRVSDRLGRGNILLVGLFGFGITMMVFSFVDSLAAVYAERVLSGVFSAAVTPVAAAAMGSFEATDHKRAQRLAFVSMAGIAGFLLGPMVSVLISRVIIPLFGVTQPLGSLKIPLVVTAILSFLIGVAVAFTVRRKREPDQAKKAAPSPLGTRVWLVPKLLALSFIVSTGIGVFEVGLALRGKQELGLAPYQIAIMFSECSLVMFAVQAILFSTGIKPSVTRWVISPALAVLAVGLFLVPRASNFSLMLIAVGTVAASAGSLSPILTYWISNKAGSAQGWELGKQTAVQSLGITIGSALGGLLYNIAALPGASFMFAGALAALGILLSFAMPHLLEAPDRVDGTALK